AEGSLAEERADFEGRWGDGAPTPSGAAAEARGELSALSSAASRGETEAGRLRQRLGSLTDKAERLAGEAQALREEIAQAESAAPAGGPTVGEPVRAHVRCRADLAGHAEVSAALDRVLAGAVCVDGGWAVALDVALDHPAAVVVTRAGDRFAASGWRVGSSAA